MAEPEPEDLKIVREAAEKLGEYFDSVQILATRHEPEVEDGTVNVSYGVGNWFTRYGHVRDWVIRSEERSRGYVRNDDG